MRLERQNEQEEGLRFYTRFARVIAGHIKFTVGFFYKAVEVLLEAHIFINR